MNNKFYDLKSCVEALKEKISELTNDYSSDTIEAALEQIARNGIDA